MMSAIWQFIVKYEFFVWMAIWAGFLIAYESTEDATYASGMGLISIIALLDWPCIRCGRRTNRKTATECERPNFVL